MNSCPRRAGLFGVQNIIFCVTISNSSVSCIIWLKPKVNSRFMKFQLFIYKEIFYTKYKLKAHSTKCFVHTHFMTKAKMKTLLKHKQRKRRQIKRRKVEISLIYDSLIKRCCLSSCLMFVLPFHPLFSYVNYLFFFLSLSLSFSISPFFILWK